ncbi:hypothetical protein F2Q69_00031544 [Brassica cretica]|uniref:Protein kinase domain-containing protein n=1 Tax=Brassica cretica TaxID=69181 RepID=A0A8S9S3Y4_BRACR|nr:hypothetical protein F2Q69_00031544 [Brassica cretica]
MEGSSNSNSRGFFNTSGVSDRNSPVERITARSKPSSSHVDEYVRSVFGSSTRKSSEEDSLGVDDPFVRSLEWGDVSLRQWLDKPERCVDVFECLHVFRQIVEIVNVAHSQGIVVHNVRPSCFVMSSFNHVSFIESASCSDSGSADSLEDGPVSHKKREDAGSYNKILERQVEKLEEEKKQPFPMKHVLAMETSWYTSPEEEFGSTSTCASDVYRLGVLLFELFCPVPSREDKSRTMSSLRHRVLPPQILLKCPKEASFCLWLLHPEPSCRPSMRRRQLKAAALGKSLARHSPLSSENGRGSEKSSVSNSAAPKDLSQNDSRQGGWIDPFLEGLCKYLSFSKLKVKADLKQGDLLNSSNLVCSLAFDRDGEFFATAGVNKKIKIFECDSIVNNNQDIHYPVVELASRSKLSSVCWNSYIKSQIASSNFEGVVQIWDVGRSQLVTEMKEHKKRVWSIDISSADPTLLASGSDDGTGASIGTIKTKANVCCVQFPSDSGRSLAFGSADHKVYYYDLRNPKIPLSTMIGHSKTVSYVKFVDSSTLVSSSTDNTLKLWDLSMSASGVNETPLHSFAGHTNLKNFVGLSVSDGYIATGSETNEVFVYHKAFPMPVMSYMFSNTDSTSGLEVDDASQFISSICWRVQSSTLVAANSNGNIKILEMVA